MYLGNNAASATACAIRLAISRRCTLVYNISKPVQRHYAALLAGILSILVNAKPAQRRVE